MKRLINNFFGYRFISATFWMFVATGSLNFGNYLYHLITGRLLGPVLYGELESIISLLYLLGIPLMTLTVVIIKFTSAYKGTGNFGAIAGLYSFFNRKLLVYGLMFAALMLILSPLIVDFLHLPSIWLMILLILTFFTSLFNMLNKAVLQGLTNFLALSLSNLTEILGKLAISIMLVFLGAKTLGAFAGFIAGGALGYILAFVFIKNSISKKGEFSEKKELLTFSVPVFLSNLALTSIYTTDILLVRHFFPGAESGFYAALSILGKIIFFAASPITFVMFPLVSEHHAARKNYSHFLLLSITITSIIVFILTLFYFLAPSIIISLLYGVPYLSISNLVGYFAIFISIYTLCFLLTNFYLSIQKAKIIALVVTAAIIQIVLIWIFHETLFDVIKVSIITTFLLLLGLLIYYPYAKTKS